MKYNLNNITEWPHYQALENFCLAVYQATQKHWKQQGFNFNSPPQVRIHSIGGRYIKLAHFEETPAFSGNLKATSVYCFVDLTNGDILKGSWKAPVAKGVRGNLNDKDILSKVTPHGTAYLTGGGAYDTVAQYLAQP
jgi:hypothetical protein